MKNIKKGVTAVLAGTMLLSSNAFASTPDNVSTNETIIISEAILPQVNNPILLNLPDDTDFIKSIKSITVNNEIVDDFTIDNTVLTIPKDYFSTIGTYKIQIDAEGYNVAEITQIVYEEGKWELDWSDEFNGTELDTTKWDCQIGDGTDYGISGWGNNEKEYYTEENVKVENGVLKITALPDDSNGLGTKYTSARIRTWSDETNEPLYATTYGRIEAKMALPTGEGLWPAFWMLPATNDYTTWAASGEIDIMEARGRLSQEVDGTIHYGEAWPNNKYSSGKHTFTDSDITEYHIYAVEWNEDEIIWYVDGEEYYRTNDWYSKSDNQEYPYPAPFDKPFYILLNLAVGGNYDGNLEPNENDLPAEMKVDYVRVYKNTAGYDASNVTPPEKPKDTQSFTDFKQNYADKDGNFINDINFETINTTSNTELNPNERNWNFVTGSDFGGQAEFTLTEENGTTWANIDVIDGGDFSYAVQMIQHMPLAQGYLYNISFDAYTLSDEQTIKLKMGGDADNAWASYSSEFEAKLTNTPEKYSFDFDMNDKTDKTARLEFNLGLDTGNVCISNIKVTAIQNATFADVPNTHWAFDAINFVVDKKIFTGTSETTFSPESSMTRAMILTVLARLDGVDTSVGNTWYETGVNWAKENGISDGENLNSTLTREQLITMLYRYAGSPKTEASEKTFFDSSDISSWAVDAMNWGVSTGLISGMSDNHIYPQQTANRAQVATILMRYI